MTLLERAAKAAWEATDCPPADTWDNLPSGIKRRTAVIITEALTYIAKNQSEGMVIAAENAWLSASGNPEVGTRLDAMELIAKAALMAVVEEK